MYFAGVKVKRKMYFWGVGVGNVFLGRGRWFTPVGGMMIQWGLSVRSPFFKEGYPWYLTSRGDL